MKYSHIIWDFNGTIFDDVDACIRAVNDLLLERSLKTLDSKEEYRRVFKFPVQDYYADIGFDFDAEPFEELAPKWIALYERYSADSKTSEGVREALEEFRRLGAVQVILSASEKNMLARQLAELGVIDYFDEIMALDNIHATSKRELGVEWVRKNPGAVALMIGDSEHDASVAAAMGVDCILLSSGHQNRETLERTGNIVCENAEELVKRILEK